MTRGAGLRVLVVDDDVDIAWALGRFLTRSGFSVTTCGDGAEAVMLMESSQVDVLITDIQMPELNGIALLEWVRQHRPGLRVIVMTAFGSASVCEVVRRKGAVLYLEKPVDLDLVVRMLRTTESRESFSGLVDEIDLFDYVQLMLVTKRQVVLRITSRGQEGLIHLDKGDVTHAEFGDVLGEQAFFRCLGFDGGRFDSMPWREPSTRTIQSRGEFLLMEAARRKDEAKHGVDTGDAAAGDEIDWIPEWSDGVKES